MLVLRPWPRAGHGFRVSNSSEVGHPPAPFWGSMSQLFAALAWPWCPSSLKGYLRQWDWMRRVASKLHGRNLLIYLFPAYICAVHLPSYLYIQSSMDIQLRCIVTSVRPKPSRPRTSQVFSLTKACRTQNCSFGGYVLTPLGFVPTSRTDLN